MMRMTVRLEDKAGETVGMFELEFPGGLNRDGIDIATVAGAEAFVQAQGKSLEYAKELTAEVDVMQDAMDDALDDALEIIAKLLLSAEEISRPAASEATN